MEEGPTGPRSWLRPCPVTTAAGVPGSRARSPVWGGAVSAACGGDSGDTSAPGTFRCSWDGAGAGVGVWMWGAVGMFPM